MEHDIRDLFNRDEKHSEKKIPKNHRIEFINKLPNLEAQKPKKKPFHVMKVAAVVGLIFCGSYFYLNAPVSIGETAKTEIQIQIELFETEYLSNIDKEWNSFIQVANDTVLVRKYKGKLRESVTDYKKINQQLKENPNNISVLESLITNLQRRLQLIKDIKEHVKELNQKNTSNETIYL